MTIGQKIKYIRSFRNMTQKELGMALNFPKQNSSNRISQYESDIKTPRDNVILSIAKALNVSPFALLPEGKNQVIAIIENFFWLETSINALSSSESYNFLYLESIRTNVLLLLIFSEIDKQQTLLWNKYIKIEDYIEFKLNWLENSRYYQEIMNLSKE